MPSEDDDIPSPAEVRKQLERMKGSDALRSAPVQSKLLRFVVQSALKNREIREVDITKVLLPLGHADPEPNNARVTATHLRQTLARYYETAGEEDPVIVELPPGKGYKPVFSYNPRSQAYQAYRRGVAHMRRFLSAEDARLALDSLNEAVRLEPTYALAYATRAEAEFREALYRPDAPPAKWIAIAEKSAREALVWDPKSWRARVVLGAIRCCRFQWKDAKVEFDTALKIAPLETADHFYYGAFLAATGEPEAGLRQANAYWRRHREDPFAGLTAAAFCYLIRESKFYSAYHHTQATIRENRSGWIGYSLLACVTIGVASVAGGLLGSTAESHVDDAHKRLGVEAFPGLGILCHAQRWADGQSAQEIRARKARLHQRIARLEIASRESYVPPLQLALAHMAVDEMEEAISDLRRACDEGDPKMAWLHLLPLFDPLREHEGFRALLKRLHLT